MIYKEKLFIYSDGGAKNNPGPAGIGVVIYDRNNKLLQKLYKYIGIATNNQAEYRAVILALETVINQYEPQEIEFFLDSQLVVEQLCGRYKVKNANITPLFQKAKELIAKIPKIRFEHITRDKNKIADALVNKAIKEQREQ
jgi:ribonuclease HI